MEEEKAEEKKYMEYEAKKQEKAEENNYMAKKRKKKLNGLVEKKKLDEKEKKRKTPEETSREAEEIHKDTMRAISLQKLAAEKIQLALQMETDGLLQLEEARSLMITVKERARIASCYVADLVPKKRKTFWSTLI